MDPVNLWLDPSEVRHLAEQLLRPVPPARLTTANPGFDASFVGFISAGEADENKSPPAPEPAAPAPQPAPEPPASAPSRTRFLERILILRDWLAKNFHATDIFILDHRGEVIFNESERKLLLLIARNFADSSSKTGDIRVKIGPAAILEVIPCETHCGRIVLGALVPEPLPASHVLAITEVLNQTASPA